MPASGHTAHGLNLWEADDRPLREDFVADNQAVEAWLSQHIADTKLHKTAADPTPMVHGTYTGDGKSMQTVLLDFLPHAVLIFPNRIRPIQKAENGSLVLYSAAVTEKYTCGPLTLLPKGGFIVQNDVVGQDVCTLLNESERVYVYLAFR